MMNMRILSFLLVQDYINILKNDGRTWDDVMLSLSAFLKERDSVLGPGKV